MEKSYGVVVFVFLTPLSYRRVLVQLAWNLPGLLEMAGAFYDRPAAAGAASPGRHCHSTLSLAAIDSCHWPPSCCHCCRFLSI